MAIRRLFVVFHTVNNAVAVDIFRSCPHSAREPERKYKIFPITGTVRFSTCPTRFRYKYRVKTTVFTLFVLLSLDSSTSLSESRLRIRRHTRRDPTEQSEIRRHTDGLVPTKFADDPLRTCESFPGASANKTETNRR